MIVPEQPSAKPIVFQLLNRLLKSPPVSFSHRSEAQRTELSQRLFREAMGGVRYKWVTLRLKTRPVPHFAGAPKLGVLKGLLNNLLVCFAAFQVSKTNLDRAIVTGKQIGRAHV